MHSEIQYLHIPARITSQNPPVILLLHGVGSNEKDLASLAEYLDPRFEVYSLRAPLTLAANQFAWFNVQFTPQGPLHNPNEAEASRQLLVRFINKLKAGGQQVFALGFSQGAIMSLSLGLTEPTLLNGIIPIAGRTLQEISASAQKQTYRQTPRVLLIHGRHDNKLPLFHGQASEAILRSLNFNPDFKIYEASHEITGKMIEDINTWLAQQIKG